MVPSQAVGEDRWRHGYTTRPEYEEDKNGRFPAWISSLMVRYVWACISWPTDLTYYSSTCATPTEHNSLGACMCMITCSSISCIIHVISFSHTLFAPWPPCKEDNRWCQSRVCNGLLRMGYPLNHKGEWIWKYPQDITNKTLSYFEIHENFSVEIIKNAQNIP